MMRTALSSVVAALLVVSVPAAAASPFSGHRLFVSKDTNAYRDYLQFEQYDPPTAEKLKLITKRPQAIWLTGDTPAATRKRVKEITTKTTRKKRLPVFVAYDIPQRDCGSYSAGGADSATAYKLWVKAIADGVGKRRAVVIMEPDALPGLDCLSKQDQDRRFNLIKSATATLERKPKLAVYLDAGHSVWQPPKTMAKRLKRAGIARAHGFSLNVSNYNRTKDEVAFGTRVSKATKGTHFVIDTSRNGQGPAPNHEWCNPAGRGLGTPPRTTHLPSKRVDALLWIKAPGESDGTCNGGPTAGSWWRDYALGLVQCRAR